MSRIKYKQKKVCEVWGCKKKISLQEIVCHSCFISVKQAQKRRELGKKNEIGLTVLNVENSDTFQEAEKMLREVNLWDKKEYERKLWTVLPKVASSQRLRGMWKGIQFGSSLDGKR